MSSLKRAERRGAILRRFYPHQVTAFWNAGEGGLRQQPAPTVEFFFAEDDAFRPDEMSRPPESRDVGFQSLEPFSGAGDGPGHDLHRTARLEPAKWRAKGIEVLC